MIKIRWTGFIWYDLWFGAYWNKEKRWLYLMVPTTGIIIEGL